MESLSEIAEVSESGGESFFFESEEGEVSLWSLVGGMFGDGDSSEGRRGAPSASRKGNRRFSVLTGEIPSLDPFLLQKNSSL